MKRATSFKMRHFKSDEWENGKEARTQEELQEIARQIKENCEIDNVVDNGFSMVTEYKNENLGIRYWIHDQFGHIGEIIEARDLN